jgi:hypothetical protein
MRRISPKWVLSLDNSSSTSILEANQHQLLLEPLVVHVHHRLPEARGDLSL